MRCRAACICACTILLSCTILLPLSPIPLGAQGASSELSAALRFGGVGDTDEERLPFTPYLGILGEAAPSEHLRLGVEYGFALVSRPEECVSVGIDDPCGSGHDLSPSARVAAQLRVEGGIGSLRPYLEGVVGYDFVAASGAKGVGVGIRMPAFLLDDGIALGIRRTTQDNRSGSSYARWEVLAELRLVSHPW